MRILIVEDDAVLGMVASAALEGEGHAVAGPAFSVAEAQALAASGKADLALVDINPDGHDEGIALARSLRAQFGIPSIFVSGQVAAARANRDAALGLLPKPYDIDDLIAIVSGCRASARVAACRVISKSSPTRRRQGPARERRTPG